MPIRRVHFAAALLLLAFIPGLQAASVVLAPGASGPAGVTLISSSGRAVVLEFRLGALELDSLSESGLTWTALSAGGMSVTARPGWPELPEKSVWLELAGREPRLVILEMETVEKSWGQSRPAPEPQSRTSAAPVRIASPDYYKSATSYPSEPAEDLPAR